MPDLRRNFFNEMIKLAKHDKSVMILVGDLGFSYCEQFQKELPNQFINAGCAEQAMIGIAGGLALAGKKPYVYSGTIFLLMRPYESIRNLCYNGLDVKLVGTGASPFLGFSHNMLGGENEEDLLKNLPIKRSYPKDSKELKKALKSKGIKFIRI